MNDTNVQWHLSEIRNNIRENDRIKARLVLEHLHEVDRLTQRRLLMEVHRADDSFAVPVLVDFIAGNPGFAEDHPVVRQLLHSRVQEAPEAALAMLNSGLGDSARAVLIDALGETKCGAALPALMDILTGQTENTVLVQSLLALGKIADPAAISHTAEYLYAEDGELILAAVQALGQFGTPEAVKRLAERLGAGTDIDLTIVDAIAASGLNEALAHLNRLLGSPDDRVRNAIKTHLTKVGRRAVPVLAGNLELADTDILIHTLNVLGDIGDRGAVEPIRDLLFRGQDDANVRFAAYEALGKLPLGVKAYTLAEGLQDLSDNVRSAAAWSIDCNYNEMLAGGVRNLLASADTDAAAIVHTIIDAHCDRIFADVIDETFFRDEAASYLALKAHPDTREHFLALLHTIGFPGLARDISGRTVSAGPGRLKVFAVDDSPMILKIYRGMLHGLGYEPHMFEFPAEALERVQEFKPDIVLTDLNMPVITGIDLARGIRRLYSDEELPVVMITTQSDGPDYLAAYDAGVSEILHKPFTEAQLEDVIMRHTARED